MSRVIAGEAQFFAASFLTGVWILFGYDILRALRRGVPHSGGAVSAEDFLYWCAAGAAVFLTAYRENHGSIRGYAAIAVLFGMLAYHQTVSRTVVKVFSFLFGHLYGGLAGICRLMLSPAGKSLKKVWKIAGKTLKNRIKEVKIIARKK